MIDVIEFIANEYILIINRSLGMERSDRNFLTLMALHIGQSE